MKTNATDGNFLEYLNILTGGALSQATIFSLSITPFINASIIMQLLTYALPPLERLRDEGEEGRKKIEKITSFVAMALAFFMAYAYYVTLTRMEDENGNSAIRFTEGWEKYLSAAVIILCFVAGASLVVWMGNRISDKGIGNGVSMILFAGIAARFPVDAGVLVELTKSKPEKYLFVSLGYLVFVIFEIGFIVFMNEAERRIPIQYAKKVVGRKMYGGQNSTLPIKLNNTGVMPIIFASSIVSLPATIGMFVNPKAGGFWDKFFKVFDSGSPLYAVLTFVLIIAFAYFYILISFNPVEVSNNLKKNGGSIPGIRPGKPTSDYITKVLNRITLIGAIFLSFIAVFPMILNLITGNAMSGLTFGGSSIIIIVGVVIETAREIEGQMTMRHYKGFLE